MKKNDIIVCPISGKWSPHQFSNDIDSDLKYFALGIKTDHDFVNIQNQIKCLLDLIKMKTIGFGMRLKSKVFTIVWVEK